MKIPASEVKVGMIVAKASAPKHRFALSESTRTIASEQDEIIFRQAMRRGDTWSFLKGRVLIGKDTPMVVVKQ